MKKNNEITPEEFTEFLRDGIALLEENNVPYRDEYFVFIPEGRMEQVIDNLGAEGKELIGRFAGVKVVKDNEN